MITLPAVEHQFSGCPCGHAEHTASSFESGSATPRHEVPPQIHCAECEAIERSEGVILSVITVQRAAGEAIAPNSIVKHAGEDHRIVGLAEILKLNGKYRTGYVRVKLRRRAA
jgi:hypothetical protein